MATNLTPHDVAFTQLRPTRPFSICPPINAITGLSASTVAEAQRQYNYEQRSGQKVNRPVIRRSVAQRSPEAPELIRPTEEHRRYIPLLRALLPEEPQGDGCILFEQSEEPLVQLIDRLQDALGPSLPPSACVEMDRLRENAIRAPEQHHVALEQAVTGTITHHLFPLANTLFRETAAWTTEAPVHSLGWYLTGSTDKGSPDGALGRAAAPGSAELHVTALLEVKLNQTSYIETFDDRRTMMLYLGPGGRPECDDLQSEAILRLLQVVAEQQRMQCGIIIYGHTDLFMIFQLVSPRLIQYTKSVPRQGRPVGQRGTMVYPFTLLLAAAYADETAETALLPKRTVMNLLDVRRDGSGGAHEHGDDDGSGGGTHSPNRKRSRQGQRGIKSATLGVSAIPAGAHDTTPPIQTTSPSHTLHPLNTTSMHPPVPTFHLNPFTATPGFSTGRELQHAPDFRFECVVPPSADVLRHPSVRSQHSSPRRSERSVHTEGSSTGDSGSLHRVPPLVGDSQSITGDEEYAQTPPAQIAAELTSPPSPPFTIGHSPGSKEPPPTVYTHPRTDTFTTYSAAPEPPAWHVTFDDLIEAGDTVDIFQVTLHTSDGIDVVLNAYATSQRFPGADLDLEDQADVFVHLEHLQGAQVARFYGLWRGKNDTGSELVVLLVEDLGDTVGATLDHDAAGSQRYIDALPRLVYSVQDAGAAPFDGIVDVFAIHDRTHGDPTENSPKHDGEPQLCYAAFPPMTFSGDAEFEDSVAVQKRWVAAWLARVRGHQ